MKTLVCAVSFYHGEVLWASIKQPWTTVTITHDTLRPYAFTRDNFSLNICVMLLKNPSVSILLYFPPILFRVFLSFLGFIQSEAKLRSIALSSYAFSRLLRQLPGFCAACILLSRFLIGSLCSSHLLSWARCAKSLVSRQSVATHPLFCIC